MEVAVPDMADNEALTADGLNENTILAFEAGVVEELRPTTTPEATHLPLPVEEVTASAEVQADTDEVAGVVRWGDEVCFESSAQPGMYWRSDVQNGEPVKMSGPTRDGSIAWRLGSGSGPFKYGDQCWLQSCVSGEFFHATVKKDGPILMGAAEEDTGHTDKMVSLLAPNAASGHINWGDSVQLKLGNGGVAALYLLSDMQDGATMSVGSNHAAKMEDGVITDPVAWHIRRPCGVSVVTP